MLFLIFSLFLSQVVSYVLLLSFYSLFPLVSEKEKSAFKCMKIYF